MQMRTTALIASLAILGGMVSAGLSATETKKGIDRTGQPPPELTEVSGRLMVNEDTGSTGGVVYFVFQSRLMEVPHENSMEKVKAMAETAVAIDADGSFTLKMSPGTYAMVYDRSAAPSEDISKPGPESITAMKKRTPNMEAIKENAEKGLPIKSGRLGDGYVIENRSVRPPIVGFGEMVLGEDHSARVLAVDGDGKPIEFPAVLRLRGMNGDIYLSHPRSVSDPGIYQFSDLIPQRYDVFALATKPKPGSGDEATTPSIENGAFMFEGDPIEHKVTVRPYKPGDDAPPPPPEPAAKKSR
jgi:hypothetical protein